MKRCLLPHLAVLLSFASAGAADRPARLPPIPDVGEPFDVRSFISASPSYRANAFTAYRHAAPSMVSAAAILPELTQANWNRFWKSMDETLEKGWPYANDEVRRWLAKNEFALEIWRRGTECADAMMIAPADIGFMNGSPEYGYSQNAREFARLACLKGTSLSPGKRPADAWTWYRAVLRSGSHFSMHTQLIGRLVGNAVYQLGADVAQLWAARPDITAGDLRQALADVLQANAMIPRPSETLKWDYLTWRKATDTDAAIEYIVPNLGPFLELVGYRERARRTLNLVYANLLSQADRPRWRRTAVCGRLGLFARDPAAPESVKVLSDEEIEKRILSFPADAKIAQLFLPPREIFDVFDIERVVTRALLLGLALQLYYREHGQFPATLAQLVKNGYLKSIPADPWGKGEPFHYRREPDPRQGAVLWSVWMDGIDQQGRLDVFRENSKNVGDRIFKISAPR